jgi:hypothetical protein
MNKKQPLKQQFTPPLPKKPYQKPAFRHERTFETMALVCGKIVSTQASCAHSKKTS